MAEKVKAVKAELFLLGLTAAFLCSLLYLSHTRQVEQVGGDIQVETGTAVAQEEILPDVTPLDINTATVEQLMTLPGIGQTLAQRIVEYRSLYGAFETPEELMEVKGIGEKTFADLEEYIRIGQEEDTP